MTLYAKELRKNFSVPLYYQLKQLLLKEIQSGAYDENVPLPPEMELAKKFQISRPTVRQAIGSLVNEGILTRTKGKGTYVIQPSSFKQQFIHQMNNYNDEIIQKEGCIPQTQVLKLEKITAGAEIAAQLEITEGSDVFELARLRFSDNLPSVLITSYIPAEVNGDFLSMDFTKKSLYQVFDHLNIPVKQVKRIFEVKMPTEEECGLLHIPADTPLFDFTTTAYTTGKIPIEYSFTKYRGDKNKFLIELSK